MKTLLLAASLVFAQTPAQTPVIRSLMYEGFKGIASDEIARRFKDRGIRVAVEEMYDPAQVDSARTVLQELLTEKGRKGVEVKSAVKQVPPKSVEVIFQAVAK
jgi:outer membrane protein assembly factor BamA